VCVFVGFGLGIGAGIVISTVDWIIVHYFENKYFECCEMEDDL
jgi:hypothetical protein